MEAHLDESLFVEVVSPVPRSWQVNKALTDRGGNVF